MQRLNVCATSRSTPSIFWSDLIEEEGGTASTALRDLGLETERVREMVERLSPMGLTETTTIELSKGAQQVLEFAIEEARLLGHQFIGTEHLLLALTRSTEGQAVEVLKKLGVTPEQVRRQTRRLMEETTSGPAISRRSAARTPGRQKGSQDTAR